MNTKALRSKAKFFGNRRFASTRLGRNGFTLIELLVVMAVISLLTAIVTISVNASRAKSRDARRIADFAQIELALAMFRAQVGKYPRSPGHATWSGHWAYFSLCLETGENCGYTVTNYSPVIQRVPQDPRRTTSDRFANDYTYYPGYPTGCSDGQSYRLAAQLETDHRALSTDLDGSYYNNNGDCNDDERWYCVGVGTCSGW